MHSITLYIQLGFQHISDMAGFDHILFLIALCAIYKIEQWRTLVILVTAFTVGHCITLALSAYDALAIPSSVIEFLIPVTIALTALHNVFRPSRVSPSSLRLTYAMALFFGLIHGMGFSNYFKALLMGSSSITIPLLGFNVGIELGQLLIVGLIIAATYLFLNVLGLRQRDWSVFVSGSAFGIACTLAIENRFW